MKRLILIASMFLLIHAVNAQNSANNISQMNLPLQTMDLKAKTSQKIFGEPGQTKNNEKSETDEFDKKIKIRLKKLQANQKIKKALQAQLDIIKMRKLRGECGTALEKDQAAVNNAVKIYKAGGSPDLPKLHTVKLYMKKIPLSEKDKIYDFEDLSQFVNESPNKLQNAWLRGRIKIKDRAGTDKYNGIEYEYATGKAIPFINFITEAGEAVFDPRDIRFVVKFPYKVTIPVGMMIPLSDNLPAKINKVEKVEKNIVCTITIYGYIGYGNTNHPNPEIWKPEDWD